MMTLRQCSDNRQHIMITLQLAPEDEQVTDLARVKEDGRDATDILQSSGYTIQPIYTGRRGGFHIEVVNQLEKLLSDITDRDTLGDVSALCTIFSTIISIAKHVLKLHQKRVAKDNDQKTPIKFMVEID